MESISTADVRRQLAELLNRSAYGKERFVVTRHGKKLVAIVPVEDLDLLERVKRLRQDGKVRAALRAAEAGDVTSWEDLKQALDL